jgi:hypothetical protein
MTVVVAMIMAVIVAPTTGVIKTMIKLRVPLGASRISSIRDTTRRRVIRRDMWACICDRSGRDCDCDCDDHYRCGRKLHLTHLHPSPRLERNPAFLTVLSLMARCQLA